MADAQTPVQPLGYIPADAVEQLAPPRLILSSVPIYTYEGVGTVPIYLAPSQPGRAVMQQALDVLEVCRDSFQRIREAGGHSTSAEIVAETAIAALSASLGQVSEPRDG